MNRKENSNHQKELPPPSYAESQNYNSILRMQPTANQTDYTQNHNDLFKKLNKSNDSSNSSSKIKYFNLKEAELLINNPKRHNYFNIPRPKLKNSSNGCSFFSRNPHDSYPCGNLYESSSSNFVSSDLSSSAHDTTATTFYSGTSSSISGMDCGGSSGDCGSSSGGGGFD